MKYLIALLVIASPFAFADDACEKEMRADPIFSKIEGPLLANEDIQKLLKGETIGEPGTVALLVGDSSTGKTHVLHTMRAGMDRDKKPHVTIRMNLLHVYQDFEANRIESISISSEDPEIDKLIRADRHNLEAALDVMSPEPSYGRHFIALASLLPVDTTIILDLSFHDVANNGTRNWGIYPGFNHRHVLMRLIELANKGKERGIRVVSTARPELLHPENPDNLAVYDRLKMIDFNFGSRIENQRIDEIYETVLAEGHALLRSAQDSEKAPVLYRDKNGEMRPIDLVRMKWLADRHRSKAGRHLDFTQPILVYTLNRTQQDPTLRNLIIDWLIFNAKD